MVEVVVALAADRVRSETPAPWAAFFVVEVFIVEKSRN